MKNVKVILLAVLLSLPLGMAFAAPQVNISEKPSLYQKELSEREMLAYINSDKGLLPVLVNRDGAFFDEKQKARVKDAAVEQVKAKNDHRAHYNAAIVFATYPFKLGLDEEWLLTPNAAENAIRHATIALNLSSATPENVPYMYLVRGNVKTDQGIGYDMSNATTYLRDRKYAQEALADFQAVERLAPDLAPYYQMVTLARELGKKELAAKYEKLQQAQSEKAAREKAAKREAEQKAKQKAKRTAMDRVRGIFRRRAN